MTRTTIILLTSLLTSFLLSSCRTGLNVKKSGVKYFDNHFSGTVYNNAFKVKGHRYGSPSLLGLLEIQNEIADSISMRFSDNHELIVTYKDNDTLKTKTFKGQFSEKGYYEIFLRNESKEIPPLFPVIFASYNINRIRMALTIQGDLIIDNSWNESGRILFLGAGDSGRRQSYFMTKKEHL